ncbi:MAG TPA: helix-turn-helix domain-containing protein [Chloroflexota bacterium]|nr:helix-turn-helix domain-containing protein [Chloroflexota bacterium]
MKDSGLPEDTEYEASGCPDLDIPSCFECPLPRCRYEMPPGRAKALIQQSRVWALLAEGQSIAEVAEVMGITRKTVYQLRRRAR